MLNLPTAAIRRWAATRPAAACLVAADGTLHSYPAVLDGIARRASWMEAHGVSRGDCLVIETENALEQRLLRWAAGLVGAVEALLDPRLSTVERSERRALINPSVVLSDPLPRWPQPRPLHPSGADDDARILFTTGTTGAAKAVLQRAGQLARVAAANARVRGLRGDDGYVAMLPPFHAAGSLFEDSMLAQGGAILLPRRSPDRLAIPGATITSLLPSQVQALADAGALSTLARLRLVNYAGESMQPSLLRRLRAAFPGSLFRGYGLTEAGPLVSVLDDHAHRHRSDIDPGEVGRPAPGVEVRIDQQESELLVRSPYVMAGYYGDPHGTAARIENGWLRTGDRAVIEDGSIRLLGRLGTRIRSGGEWVDPAAIERCLSAMPGIDEAVVVGEPSVQWGERPIAFVRASAQLTECDLRRYLEAHLPRFKWPDRVELIDEMPRTAVGKTDRAALAIRAPRASIQLR